MNPHHGCCGIAYDTSCTSSVRSCDDSGKKAHAQPILVQVPCDHTADHRTCDVVQKYREASHQQEQRKTACPASSQQSGYDVRGVAASKLAREHSEPK